ncbi:Microcystin LR degradation protein MlrC [Trematosphaeria pertusa]|uniref:Microcystin LR degradation protein MlrC n=1 Tax=Trematosphaeria pertusa TaxID=390896 RepID=A0A6A6IQB2_9PLEO|nr:Microcystin LR degradation protein MlrC [Trematosphaeria pertusa]KAF2251693.1 Microcystin LR degradation protein MlrC [Trematosphaeria pertusa]
MSRLPIIAIAGLACENSTFTPSRTRAAAFRPKRGEEIIRHYDFLQTDTALGRAAIWKGALIGYALPGGIVERASFEELAGEIISRLTDICQSLDEPLDGFWFDIHGALYVDGFEDAEFELLRRIRTVIGHTTIVSASMDLHGNVSHELAHETDLITCYRTAPHVDVRETKERACRNLIQVLDTHNRGGSLPLKAWIPIPILLPGEQTSTRDEPAKRIYAAVSEVEKRKRILDAAIWVGYAWADEPRNRAAVVVTGSERDAVAIGAEELAQIFWTSREDFKFVAPTGSFSECLNIALASTDRPYFISDSGDNPTAGGSGDVTWGLTQLLARPEFKDSSGPTVIYASIPGPAAVEAAAKAGIGATLTVTAGAEVDNLHAGPITMTGRVHSIKHGDPHACVEVVLQVGSVFVIVTKLRKPYHKERDFAELNLNPRSADIVIVKIGYLEPELYDMAKDWMLALTPGGVDQDLKRLGHHRIQRPMFPFDTVFNTEPDLRARFIPSSRDPLDAHDK